MEAWYNRCKKPIALFDKVIDRIAPQWKKECFISYVPRRFPSVQNTIHLQGTDQQTNALRDIPSYSDAVWPVSIKSWPSQWSPLKKILKNNWLRTIWPTDQPTERRTDHLIEVQGVVLCMNMNSVKSEQESPCCLCLEARLIRFKIWATGIF